MTKMKGLGTVLQVEISSVYTTVAQRVEISGPSLETRHTETTDLDSTKAEYKPTISDAGTVSGSLYYDPNDSTHDHLFDLWDSPEVANWKLIFTDTNNVEATFSGILEQFEPSNMTAEDYVQANYSIKLTGGVTLTGAS